MANDGSVKIGVELDDTSLKKGLNNVQKDNRKTFEQMAKDTGKSIDQIKAEVKKMAEEYQKQGMNIPNSYKKAYKEMGLLAEKNAKEMAEQAEKISNSYEKTSNQISNSIKKGLSGLGGLAKSGIAGLGKITSTVFSATTKAIGGVSAGIAGLGTASVNVGKEFESAMSKVQATSGASTEDLEKLKQTALEMGSSTKFSATESAEALNYMAMAGWKTEQMIGGIGGIMDLAAASGEDLAMVSDIVTDGLTAFTLKAKESGRFADVLAAASSNANTNVSMLGESFKFVAPVAGALGYSIEDTSVALGLMANAGIKASSSGTALRTLMTNLASPTKNSAKAMAELGLNIQDAEGNMLPFNDVMLQLRDGFNGLTKAEKAQYAEMLAGKEGMSGLLAIVNASQADFDKLTGAINDSSGAAAEMADIMSDNLQGRLKELSSKLENLQLKIYESIQEPLKEVTEYIIGLVTELQKAFDEGGFEGVLNSLSDILAKVLTDIAAKAPQLIEIATQFILNFLQGITENSSQLGQAGSQILTSLINGIFEILPQFIETAANLIINFQEGLIQNLPTLLESGKKMLENLAKGITENLPIILKNSSEILMQLVNGLIDNLPLIVNTGIDIILALVDSLVETLPELIPAAVEAILTIVDALMDNLDKIIDAAIELILALAVGLIDAIPLLLEKVPVIITKLVLAFKDPTMRVKLIDAGIQLILALIEGIINSTISIVKAVFDIGKEMVKTVLEFPKEFLNAGKDLIRGLIEGIKSMGSEIYNTLKNFCSGIVDNVKGFFGIHSPSRVFRDEIGVWLSRGLAIGIESENDKVVGAITTPFYDAEKEVKNQGNIFTKDLVSIISNASDEAKKEAKNYAEVGDILIDSISGSVKKNVDDILTPLTEEIKKNLNENIEVVEKNAEELIDTYTKKIQTEAEAKKEKIDVAIKNLSKTAPDSIKKQLEKDKKAIDENAKQLIKTYSDGIKKSVETEKNNLKNTTDDLLNVLTTNFEQSVQQVNEIINEKIGGLAENYQTKFNDLVKAQEDLANKLADSKLFSFEEDNLVVENLEETISTLEKYDQAITQLKEKGISDAILNELASYNTEEVLKIAEKLLQMTDTEFKKLNDKWEEKQELATKVASNFYKEQMQVLEKDFKAELTKTLNELPTQVEDIGIMTIVGFQNGLQSKMGTILDDVRSFAESVIEQMQRALDIHSPSRKTEWLGEMLDEGLVKGIENGEKGILNTIKNLGIIDAFKQQIPNIQGVINSATNSMIPRSSQYVTNSMSSNNITNNQGDFVVNISGIELKNNMDVKTMLQEFSFYQKQRELAFGGV